SGNGSAATSREAGPDPANPQQFQSTSETACDAASVQKVSLMEFSFKGQRVRPVLLDGETWFVAADVCTVLEHTQPSKAVLRLDDDEKGVTTVPTLGGSQEMLVVSESGLYALIFSSRKPEARAFRRWVTGEVLPAIRKTDRYEMGQLPPCPGMAVTSWRRVRIGRPTSIGRATTSSSGTPPTPTAGSWLTSSSSLSPSIARLGRTSLSGSTIGTASLGASSKTSSWRAATSRCTTSPSMSTGACPLGTENQAVGPVGNPAAGVARRLPATSARCMLPP